LSKEENLRRNADLLKDIIDNGYSFMPGKSYEPGSKSWIEYGFLILEMDSNIARKLAQKYEQMAFISGERYQKAQLVFI